MSMLAFDPICGMEVNPEMAAFSTHYRGQTYFCCSGNCKDHFDYNPALYSGIVEKETI